MQTNGFELLLPDGVLDYFAISKVEQHENDTTIYLQEKNVIPDEYIGRRLESKGFYEDSKVQDFPLRGKAVYLIVQRRKWIDKDTGDYVVRHWEMVAKGTRMTQEFATFLKGISRY
jgi:predicted adenine nucleotide alpha hydrolase (AANH) superfamily ATPase